MSKDPSLLRGVRLKNPGNIRKGQPWQGLAVQQVDREFCTFASPEFGIRAMVIILRNYTKPPRSLRTIRQFVSTWAPPSENNTEAYVKDVATRVGNNADEPLDLADVDTVTRLVKALIWHEQGCMPYDDATISKGISMAPLTKA